MFLFLFPCNKKYLENLKLYLEENKNDVYNE